MDRNERLEAQWERIFEIVEWELTKLANHSRASAEPLGLGERQTLEALARTLRVIAREAQTANDGGKESLLSADAIEKILEGGGSRMSVVPEAPGGGWVPRHSDQKREAILRVPLSDPRDEGSV